MVRSGLAAIRGPKCAGKCLLEAEPISHLRISAASSAFGASKETWIENFMRPSSGVKP
jgi:hypothetical protein